MFRKIFMGLLAVAIVCAIAGAGYKFGKYLATNGNGTSAQVSGT
jgi:hypothetical protein